MMMMTILMMLMMTLKMMMMMLLMMMMMVIAMVADGWGGRKSARGRQKGKETKNEKCIAFSKKRTISEKRKPLRFNGHSVVRGRRRPIFSMTLLGLD